MVVANKMDLPEAEENLRLLRERYPKITTAAISAEQGTGVEDLRSLLRTRLIDQAPVASNA